MKNTIINTIIASIAFGGSVFAGTTMTSGKGVAVVEPETSPFSTTLTVGYASTYEYRGLEIGDNLFNADLTTTYTVNDKMSIFADAWYGTLWDGNYDELDLSAGVNYDLGIVNATLLYKYYFYDADFGDNNEIGLVLTTKDWNGLKLYLGGYYDFEFDGYYFELGGAYSRTLNDMVSVQLSTGVSYVDNYVLDGDGFNHVFVQAGLPIAIAKNVTLTPFIKGTWALDVLDDAGGDDLVLGGVNLAVTF